MFFCFSIFGHYLAVLAILVTTATPHLKMDFFSKIRLGLAKLRFMKNFSPLLNFGDVLDQNLSQSVNI